MSTTRVHYRERQRLTAADLGVEQDYRLGLAGRHHVTHHEWGVVRGLSVVEIASPRFLLTPGIAIDGWGREIVVSAPVEIAIDDPNECKLVLLYFCEAPEQVPPGRVFKVEPAPRIHAAYGLSLADEYTGPLEAADDFARAHGAGMQHGLPLWPVPIARIGNCGSLTVDVDETRYVRHRAALIRSPSGRAQLQLGLSNLQDVNHFLLSTMSPQGTLTGRIGINRDGVVQIWRSLVIAGTHAVGKVALGHQQSLLAMAMMPAGLFRRIQVTGVLDRKTRTLSASLRDTGGLLATPRLSLLHHQRFRKQALSLRMRFGTASTVSFRRLDVAGQAVALGAPFVQSRQKASRRAGRIAQNPKGATGSPDLEEFTVALGPAGGKLSMFRSDRIIEIETKQCGDVERIRDAAGEPYTPVVQFKPAPGIETDASMREIYAVVTSKPADAVPATDLRISGGGEDETDASPRVTAGAWVTPAKFQFAPILRMDGNRRIEIRQVPGTSQDKALVQVTRTTYLPPIGKKDPLLPDLLVLARMSGMWQAGRLTPVGNAVLTIQTANPQLTRGGDLVYTLKISTFAGVTFKRCFELIVGEQGSGELIYRSMDDINAGTIAAKLPTPMSFPIVSKKITHSATWIRLIVAMLLNNGTVDSLAVSKPVSIEVVD